MSTMSEAVESVLASREAAARIAAAREEQREACARHITQQAEYANSDGAYLDKVRGLEAGADYCRSAPLSATPLADENQALRAQCNAIAARLDAAGVASVADLVAERDALRAQLGAMREALVEAHDFLEFHHDPKRPAATATAVNLSDVNRLCALTALALSASAPTERTYTRAEVVALMERVREVVAKQFNATNHYESISRHHAGELVRAIDLAALLEES